MKIAYISSAFLSDCDMPLIQAMTLRGEEVYYFLLMSDSSRQATMINVGRLKAEGGVFPATEYPELSHLSAYMPLDRIFVINMPSPHDWAPSSVKAMWKAYRMIRRGEFDVVHLTSPLRYGAFLLYLLRRRMVLTVHDPLPHSSDRGWLNRFHRAVAFRLVDRFILLSQSLVDEFVEVYNINKENVFVSRLGVYDVLLNVEPTAMNLPDRYILFVGSINPHKGIRYLCEAMRQLRERCPDLHLVIAGRGNFDFDIESYVAQGNITLINRFVTDGELRTLLQQSLFAVCPYVDATQSGVIMSAFALSKPVLATNVGALPEMLTHGRHGLLVPPRDATALAEAVRQMLDADVLRRMEQAIDDDFRSGSRSWSKIAERTTEIFTI